MLIDSTWRWFRQLPWVAQALAWVFLFWLLVPVLIWRTTWSRNLKIGLTVAFVLFIAVLARTPVPTPNDAAASRTSGDAGTHGPPADGSIQDSDESAADESNGSDNDKPAEKRSGPVAVVARVIDGDTIEVSREVRTIDVRLIGIDTPETAHPSEPVECFGPAASDFTTRHLAGSRVRLEFDVERLDRYGRTLAYVWSEGKLFNKMLVERGFAQVSTYPPNVKYVELFRAAQRRARQADRGLWAGCPAEGDTEDDVTDGTSGDSKKCDPSYEGACIPPYPPDLDCTEVAATGFQSVGSDPHGFDGDGDGIACE